MHQIFAMVQAGKILVLKLAEFRRAEQLLQAPVIGALESGLVSLEAVGPRSARPALSSGSGTSFASRKQIGIVFVGRIGIRGEMGQLLLRRLRPRRRLAAPPPGSRRLAELHVNYEQQIEYPLERVEKGQLNWRIEKMRLGGGRTNFAQLQRLPHPARHPARDLPEYRSATAAGAGVGDRPISGLDRQAQRRHQRSQSRRRSRVHRALIGQVITVSLATMEIVKALPELRIQASGGLWKAVPSLKGTRVILLC